MERRPVSKTPEPPDGYLVPPIWLEEQRGRPMGRWLPVVNPREGELLTELGATEDRDFRVWRPAPEIEVWPSTIARMTRPLTPPGYHAPYTGVGSGHQPVTTHREKRRDGMRKTGPDLPVGR